MNNTKKYLYERIEGFQKFLNSNIDEFINKSSDSIILARESGSKIIICGNGGSAAESSQFAAELIVRYKSTLTIIHLICELIDVKIIL